MQILVINGSPKAKHSITLQHIHFLTKETPDHEINIISVANRIAKIERDEALFDDIIQQMVQADAVIWSFPVYYALIPSQLKRFIELINERCAPGIFKDKYTTSFTTSINFFDHTAHNYMQGVCEDLGFNYVKSYSANMNDFFHADKREMMISFYQWFVQIIEQKVAVYKKYHIHHNEPIVYEPGDVQERETTVDQKILLLTDAKQEDANLANMVEVFKKTSAMRVDVKNIHDINMKNGCVGCCNCGYDNTCVQKDDYQQFYNDNLKKADIIIFAGKIKDHYLSSTWKKFIDRSFFNGHVPVLMGKRMGFIISGPLSQRQNLREVLESHADNWHMKTCGFLTDEHRTSEEITRHVMAFAKEIELANEQNLEFGDKFYRVAGKKLFRDYIYTSHAVFRADHIFFKKIGTYKSFPQRKLKKRVFNAIFKMFISIKPIRKKIHAVFIPKMVEPYQKVLDRI